MSPLEIEIALHYWTSPQPYKKGSENWTDLECKIVQSMLDCGMLEHAPNKDVQKISGNTPAMRAYIQALQAVQRPVIQWVVPTGPCPVSDGEVDVQKP